MALGTTYATLLWMVTGSRLRLALAGVIAGVLLAPLAGRAMTALLYGVSTMDMLTLIVTPVLTLITALVVSAVPGWIAAAPSPCRCCGTSDVEDGVGQEPRSDNVGGRSAG